MIENISIQNKSNKAATLSLVCEMVRRIQIRLRLVSFSYKSEIKNSQEFQFRNTQKNLDTEDWVRHHLKSH